MENEKSVSIKFDPEKDRYNIEVRGMTDVEYIGLLTIILYGDQTRRVIRVYEQLKSEKNDR